jgi:hypothetical protein
MDGCGTAHCFVEPFSVQISADGTMLATGTSDGGIILHAERSQP